VFISQLGLARLTNQILSNVDDDGEDDENNIDEDEKRLMKNELLLGIDTRNTGILNSRSNLSPQVFLTSLGSSERR